MRFTLVGGSDCAAASGGCAAASGGCGNPLLAGRFHRNDGRLHEVAEAPDVDSHVLPNTLGAECAVQVVDISDRTPVKPQYQVATLEPAPACRPLGTRADDAYGRPRGKVHMAAQTLWDGDRLRHEPQVTASHSPVLQQL